MNDNAGMVIRLMVYATITGFFIQKVVESALKLQEAEISTLTKEVRRLCQHLFVLLTNYLQITSPNVMYPSVTVCPNYPTTQEEWVKVLPRINRLPS